MPSLSLVLRQDERLGLGRMSSTAFPNLSLSPDAARVLGKRQNVQPGCPACEDEKPPGVQDRHVFPLPRSISYCRACSSGGGAARSAALRQRGNQKLYRRGGVISIRLHGSQSSACHDRNGSQGRRRGVLRRRTAISGHAGYRPSDSGYDRLEGTASPPETIFSKGSIYTQRGGVGVGTYPASVTVKRSDLPPPPPLHNSSPASQLLSYQDEATCPE